MQITFKGNPLTLVGRSIQVGAPAPDFKAAALDLKEASLADFKGTIKVLTSFPSLDTSVCDLQVKEFNKITASLSPEVHVIGISKDLPFAQKRFCDEFTINKVTLLSDYKTSSFGINYGLLIKELNLLARAVLIVDKNDVLRYVQVVKELTTPPDYKEAVQKVQEVVKDPAHNVQGALPAHCTPCEGGVAPMPKERVAALRAKYLGWELVEEKKLVKEFKLTDFVEAKYLLDLVSVIAEEQGHHPTLTLMYNKLRVTLTTHTAGGLTENDFIMAKIIDEVAS